MHEYRLFGKISLVDKLDTFLHQSISQSLEKIVIDIYTFVSQFRIEVVDDIFGSHIEDTLNLESLENLDLTPG